MNSNNPQNSVNGNKGLRLVAVTALVAALALAAVAGAGAVAAEETEDEEEKPENPFKVSIDNTNMPVEEGEPIAITATVTNTGNESDTQTVRADAPGLRDSGAFVTLSEGVSETVTLSMQTNPRHVGDHTITVESDDHNSTTVDHNVTTTVTVDRD